MDILLRGWHRDHGSKELFSVNLQELKATNEVKEYPPHRATLEVVEKNGRISDVYVSAKVSALTASGDYLLQVKLKSNEILYLYWLALRRKSLAYVSRAFNRFEQEPDEDV